MFTFLCLSNRSNCSVCFNRVSLFEVCSPSGSSLPNWISVIKVEGEKKSPCFQPSVAGISQRLAPFQTGSAALKAIACFSVPHGEAAPNHRLLFEPHRTACSSNATLRHQNIAGVHSFCFISPPFSAFPRAFGRAHRKATLIRRLLRCLITTLQLCIDHVIVIIIITINIITHTHVYAAQSTPSVYLYSRRKCRGIRKCRLCLVKADWHGVPHNPAKPSVPDPHAANVDRAGRRGLGLSTFWSQSESS